MRRVIAMKPEFRYAYNLLGVVLVRVGDVRARRGNAAGAIKSYGEVLSMEWANDDDRQNARSHLESIAR